MDRLARLLNRERLLLELLVFKLVELRQLLLISETRFLGWAAQEVERAVEAVRDAEIERAVLVDSLAGEPGGNDETMLLRDIAADAPEPWRTVLEEDRVALLRLSAEVQDNLASARSLASAGAHAVSELLDRVADSDPEPALATYGPQATLYRSAPAPRVERTL